MNSSEIDNKNLKEKMFISEGKVGSLDDPHNKCLLDKIKSDHILKEIFGNIRKGTLYKTIRYNKRLQNKLNITKKDYKDFGKIIIELYTNGCPSTDRPIFIYNNCLNLNYYHFYFNEDKNEQKEKKIYYDINRNVKKIRIELDYEVKSLCLLFKLCESIKAIHFLKFNRSDIRNIDRMFWKCDNLKEINLSNFNSENIDNMRELFSGLKSLEKINLSVLNTKNVKSMEEMFKGCISLKELDLSGFNTKNVTTMEKMFDGCISLKELDLSNFNTENVENMSAMFFGCTALKKLKISNFNTDKVDDLRHMFNKCTSLEELDVSKFKFEGKNVEKMFIGLNDEIIKAIRTNNPNIKEKAFKYF